MLSTGSRVGPYRILGILGQGGMGEVYRARDERLERDVAIKVLRQEASSDPDYQRRFAQEARAASGLNHPNILTVHDVGMENGQPYIVTELIDGDALTGLIARGPVAVKKTLDIAVQVAGGLAAAHRAGIVHRDLKPANLMITREGFAKILDFGLAKNLFRTAAAGAEKNATATGFVAGTATYMSPEQAGGAALDHRTDQFSFGLVLYEMLTGTPAFSRASAISTMAAIIEEQPKPIADLNPAVPAPLRWLIERCLAKDREERYTSTADLERELQVIRAHMSETTSGVVAAAPPPARKRRLLPAGLGITGLMAGILSTWFLLVPESAVDMTAYRLRPVASLGHASSPAWSVDGKSLAYVADVSGVRQVFVRELASPMAGQITNSAADCERPFWSHDGSRIYYFGRNPENGLDLYAVGATGGSADIVQKNAAAAAMAPDGKTIVFLRADPTGKDPLALWTASGDGAAREYKVGPLASGRYRLGYLAFTRRGKGLGLWLSRWDGHSEFWMVNWPETAARQAFSLAQDAYPFGWMPDGRNIVFGGIVRGSMGADLQMVDTRNGHMRPVTAQTQDALEASVSPDGSRIAFRVSEENFDLLLVPLDGSPARSMATTSRDEFDPVWSPTGDQLVYSTDRTGTSQLWIASPRESWERPLVTEKDFGQEWIASLSEPSFSPDGKRVVYAVSGSSGHSVYISNLAGGKPLRLSSETTDERSPSWNGDGSWIAYLRNVNGAWTLVKARSGGGEHPVTIREGCLPVRPRWNRKNDRWIACVTAAGLTLVSADGSETQVLSAGRWLVFGWSPDGKSVYGIKQLPDRRRVIAAIDIEKRSEKVIGDLPLPADAEVRGFSLAADGKSFATSTSRPAGDIWILEGFRKPAALGL